jgi:hypothetical protein
MQEPFYCLQLFLQQLMETTDKVTINSLIYFLDLCHVPAQ